MKQNLDFDASGAPRHGKNAIGEVLAQEAEARGLRILRVGPGHPPPLVDVPPPRSALEILDEVSAEVPADTWPTLFTRETLEDCLPTGTEGFLHFGPLVADLFFTPGRQAEPGAEDHHG